MPIIRHNGNQFSAQISRFTLEMKDYTRRVWTESMIELVRRMQLPVRAGGNMPVLTGFLRSSLMASTSPVASGSRRRPDDRGPYVFLADTQVESVIRSAKIGQKIYLGYLADYWMYAEYGRGESPGHGFVRLAVQLWPSIVEQVKSRISS